MSDSGGKTEKPTQRRLDKSRKEGQYVSAKEFVSALQFLVFLALLSTGGAQWFAGFRRTTRSLLTLAFRPELTPQDLVHVAWQVSRQHIFPLALAGMIIAGAILGPRVGTNPGGSKLY